MEKSIGTAALLGAMCLALMPVAPANAANWVYVAENSDGAVYYYDADTLQRSGDAVTVWEKSDHSRDATVKYRAKMSLTRYYCSRRTYALISVITYYPNGKSDSFSWSSYEQKEGYIAPDTVGQRQLEAACG